MNYRNFENNIHDRLYNSTEEVDVAKLINVLNNEKAIPGKKPWLIWLSLAMLCLTGGLFLIRDHIFTSYHQDEKTLTSMDNFVYQAAPLHTVNQSSNSVAANLAIEASSRSNILAANDQYINKASVQANNTHSLDKQDAINTTRFEVQSAKYSKAGHSDNHQSSTDQFGHDNGLSYTHHLETKPVDSSDNAITADNTISENAMEIAKLRSVEAASILSTLPLLKKNHVQRNKRRIEVSDKISILGSKDIQCPTFARKSSMQFSFIPEVGYFVPFQSLSAPVTEQNEVFTLRSKNEKSLEGLQAAMYIQAQKKDSPLFFKAGVNFARFSERMKLDYTYTKKDTTVGIISITKSPTGDTITTIYGNIITETTKTGTKVAHHYFQLFDIPIAIGYERPLSSFMVGGEIGAMINVSMQSTGKILDTATDFKAIGIDSPYKKSIGVNYFASLFVSKEIGEQHSIYLALRGRFMPSTFTKINAPISEKYTLAGIHLGYKILF